MFKRKEQELKGEDGKALSEGHTVKVGFKYEGNLLIGLLKIT